MSNCEEPRTGVEQQNDRLRQVELTVTRLDAEARSDKEALRLQAKEYERRLHDLNGEYARDRQRQGDFVSLEKYESTIAAEKSAREIALSRVDEKFAEYVKRYELRQHEIDLTLATMEATSREAKRVVEEQARKTNRNIAIMGLVLAALVGLANFLGTL